jgi:hypothetical protein
MLQQSAEDFREDELGFDGGCGILRDVRNRD